jgi:hypothetical protein
LPNRIVFLAHFPRARLRFVQPPDSPPFVTEQRRRSDTFDRYNKPGASSWFDLSDDVSFTKPNNRHDALKVESLLGYGGYMDLDQRGGPLGLSRGTLEKPIKAFQARNGLEVDGWLKPGGPTIKKMQALYGNVFGAMPAPTPAMMDAHVEKRDAGEEGFLHDTAPTFGVKPNPRLDRKAPLMEFERWNRDWARGSGNDPKGLAREYETYIRDLDKDHGHDPGLIFARDLTQQVEKYHGRGSDMAKQFVTLLADRPDLQRQYLGGEVPKAPPVGTFKPGGLDGVKNFIDQDRVANGIAPRYAIPAAAQAQDTPQLQRLSSSGAAPAPIAANLLEYGQHYGLPQERFQPPESARAPDSASKSEVLAESSEKSGSNPQEIATGRPPERRECTESWLKIWENNQRQDSLSGEKAAIERDIQEIESLIASRNRDRIREYLDKFEQPDREVPETDQDRKNRPPTRPGGGRPRPISMEMSPRTSVGRGPKPNPSPTPPPTPPRPGGQKPDWKDILEGIAGAIEKGAEIFLPGESIEAAISAAEQRLQTRRRDLASVEQRQEAAAIQLRVFREERQRLGCDAHDPSERHSDSLPSAQKS